MTEPTAAADQKPLVDDKGRPLIDAAGNRQVWVDLDNPIKRGGADVYEIRLRKPDTGHLRGTKFNDLFTMDVNAASIVVPRISDPVIPTAEFLTLAPEDAAQITGEIVGFLLTKRQKVAGGLDA
jgi:Phage tail assembly chaperone proteins, E, or 41 or 14